MSEGAGAKKRSLIVGGISLVVVIGGLMAAVYGGRLAWGSGIGEKCGEDFDCKPDHICISKRCRLGCEVDADCEEGWGCRGTSVSVTQGGDARKGYAIETVRICFSPDAMESVHAKELQQKIADRKHAVRLKTIVALTTTPPQLTDAQFDTAWAKIPDEEKASASEAALAKRVLRLAGR